MMKFRDTFLEDVMWRGAIGSRGQAEEAIQMTLETLAPHLTPADATTIARTLSGDPAQALPRRRSPSPAQEPSALYQRLAANQRISLGVAVERAHTVCEAIATHLDSEPRALISRRLPPAWAELFVPTSRAPETDRPRGTPAGHGHTLATGKPGSRHPLSEASPRADNLRWRP